MPDTSSSSTTRTVFSKFVVLRPLRPKTADEVAQCLVHIFCEHGPPHILHTDNGAEFSNKTLLAILHRLRSSTRIVHGRPRHPEDQGSVERANADFKNLLYATTFDLTDNNPSYQFSQYNTSNVHSTMQYNQDYSFTSDESNEIYYSQFTEELTCHPNLYNPAYPQSAHDPIGIQLFSQQNNISD